MENEKIVNSLDNIIDGYRNIKKLHEKIEEKKFAVNNVKYLDVKSRMYKYMGSFHAVNRIFEGIMYIIVV